MDRIISINIILLSSVKHFIPHYNLAIIKRDSVRDLIIIIKKGGEKI